MNSTFKAGTLAARAIPSPLNSYEQALMFEYADLISLSDAELFVERQWALHKLLGIGERDLTARDWLLERVRRISAELRKRQKAR